MHIEIRIQTADFDLGQEYAALRSACGADAGAVAAFAGLVRDRNLGEDVSVLELEHYPGMTERSIEAIVRQAAARWPLLGMVVVHRVGALPVGEQIVLAAAASAHRGAAFAACEFVMDYLKTDAVLWKREHGTTGNTRWVESTDADRDRVSAWRK